jgi:uncharacterized damage-inducible protein DinB
MKISELKTSDYHSFYTPYIKALGDVELMEILKKQVNNFPEFMASIPEEKLQYAYGEDKWTIMQVLVHILDAERVFQYRALRFARNDATALPSFNQDAYVPISNANSRKIEDVINEYKAVRNATIALFSSFDEDILKRVGIASQAQMSVGALGFMCCGHQKHHKNILKERYLNT